MFQSPIYLWLLLLLPYFIWLGWPHRGKYRFVELTALLLRGILIVSVILGLAGFTLRIPNDDLSVIYLLDVSDSIPETSQQAAMQFIKQSLKEKSPDDMAGLITFGGNALVERPLSTDLEFDEIESAPLTGHTDIGEAINLAQALFPENMSKRIVLLSDGDNNQGSLQETVRIADTNGIDLIQVPLASTSSADAGIIDLQLPARLTQARVEALQLAP